MEYYNKFQNIHELLKEYSCEPTYKDEKEYNEQLHIVDETDIFFYESLKESNAGGRVEREWAETINAIMDVCIKTKMAGAVSELIRFDIVYSDKVKKYSMYISLPTHSKSTSLSKNTYKNQDEVIAEIKKYLLIGKCEKVKIEKKLIIQNSFEQIGLF